MGLATINIKFQADLRGFSTEMQNSMRRIGAFGNQMQSIGKGMSLYLTAPIVAAGAAAVKMASDYEESVNKVDVAFKDSAAGVKEFAKTSLESFGIAEGTALDMASTYGDMGTSLGLAQDKAAKMSTSLVGLAGDLSSFKNIGIEQANTALAGIFTGETESLKKLGIVMTEANLQNFAYSKGIKTKISDMDQASKVNLRYAYIMSVTTNAQGDFIRTGGGAANQMRIFQESLKQVGQQFGSIVLPAFTKAITFVNGLIKSFGDLSQGTKVTIVSFAAVAAATGPVLTVFGSMLTFVPNLITRFNALKDSLLAMQAVLLANPYTAVAVGLGVLAAIVLTSTSRFNALTNAQKDFVEINKVATDSIAKEKAELEKNLDVAKNKDLSNEVRKKAIQDLNALSPQHLGNLNLENIYTKQATESVNNYTAALMRKARVQAAEEKLVEVQKKLLDLQMGNNDAVKPSVWQNLGNAMLSAGNSTSLAVLNAKTLGENYGQEYDQLNKLSNALTSYIGKNKEVTQSTDPVIDALSGVAASAEKVKRATLEPISISLNASLGTVDEFDVQIAKLKEFQKAFKIEPTDLIKTAETTEQMTAKMTASVAASSAAMDVEAEKIKDRQQRILETGALVADSVSNTFGAIGTSIVDSFGLAKNGLEGFIGGLANTLVQLGQIVVKQLIMNQAQAMGSAVAGATASGAATGPAAIFTTPAFIATAIAGVIGAFAAIPKFETGGIFGGTSFYGDKILARVNSGELVANNDQQKRIWNAMNSGGNYAAGGFVASTRLVGSDMLLLIERAQALKDRIG